MLEYIKLSISGIEHHSIKECNYRIVVNIYAINCLYKNPTQIPLNGFWISYGHRYLNCISFFNYR